MADRLHVMMDLETWGTRPGSAIRSIGACVFNMEGHNPERHSVFYTNISDESCLSAGLTKDESTVQWWSEQSEAAQQVLAENPRSLRDAVLGFNLWLGRQGDDVRLWAHGASFDPVLWQAACDAVGEPFAVKFWDFRDTRTVYDLAEINLRQHRTAEMVHHYALDDCVAQSNAVAEGLRKLLGNPHD